MAVRTAWLAGSLLLLAGAAGAQAVAPPTPVAGEHAPAPPDPGRPVPYDREGLSSRGGANPTQSDKTFDERIGTPIYAPIGTAIGTQLGVHR